MSQILIVRKIRPLWEELSSNFTVFLNTYQNKKLRLSDLEKTISAIDNQINDFSQNGADFTVLAARMMIFSKEYLHLLIENIFIYISAVFTSDKKPEDCIKNNTNDKGQLESHSIYELLSDTFNPEDINRMMVDNLWQLYSDSKRHDEEKSKKIIE